MDPNPGWEFRTHSIERLADQLYARIAAAPLAWRDGRHSGELQHRVDVLCASHLPRMCKRPHRPLASPRI